MWWTPKSCANSSCVSFRSLRSFVMSEGAILNIEFLIDHLHQISEGLIHIISRTAWPPKSKLSDSRWLPKQGAISPIMKGQFHFPCRTPANLRISFSREIYQAMHPLFAILANKTLGTSISELFKNFTRRFSFLSQAAWSVPV